MLRQFGGNQEISIMSMQDPIARRTIIKGAGAGLGAGLLAGVAQAAETGGGAARTITLEDVRAAVAAGGALASGKMWSGEYWAQKGDVRLNLWRKRLAAPQAGEPPRPTLFLVHGSSNSSRTSYDLDVPGHGEYSLMNAFARYGFDVWTMDHDGYGRSGSSGNNSDIASGVEDLKAGTEVVARETGQQKFHFCGSSSGAIRAGAFAAAQPGRVNRLVL